MFSIIGRLRGTLNQLATHNLNNPGVKILSLNNGTISWSHPAYIHLLPTNFNNIKPISSTEEEESLDKLFKIIEIEVKGNDPAVLKSYTWFAITAANHLGIEVGKSWTPRRPNHERYTLLRSIHVNKNCRVQYEFRTYYHFMQFHRLTGSTADTYLEYIQRNLPEGVAMKVTKVALEKIPGHLKPPVKQIEEAKIVE
uniref:Small ribosomal subunit protein uS10m n=1 Tax=Clastoptera arizonana TaxID=38151 RepID=A0A1B6DFF4_9HEMI